MFLFTLILAALTIIYWHFFGKADDETALWGEAGIQVLWVVFFIASGYPVLAFVSIYYGYQYAIKPLNIIYKWR